jgi:hypothetical protein
MVCISAAAIPERFVISSAVRSAKIANTKQVLRNIFFFSSLTDWHEP